MQVGSNNAPPIFTASREWMQGSASFSTTKLPEYGDYPSNFAVNRPYDSLYISHGGSTIHTSWPSYGHQPHQGLGNLVVAAQKYLHYSGM